MAAIHSGLNLPRLGRHLLVAVMALTALAAWGQHHLVRALLPWLQAELSWLDPNYQVHALTLQSVGADASLQLTVSQARPIHLNGQTYPPDTRGRAHASTPAGHLVQPLVLLLAVAWTWPLNPTVARRRQLLLRTTLAGMGSVLLIAMDVPFVLWASIWALHMDFSGSQAWSPLLTWAAFMEGGGRLALGLASGLAAAALSRTNHPTSLR